jgi:hypothetical protein
MTLPPLDMIGRDVIDFDSLPEHTRVFVVEQTKPSQNLGNRNRIIDDSLQLISIDRPENAPLYLSHATTLLGRLESRSGF